MSIPAMDPPPALAELSAFARPRLRPDVPVMWRTQTSLQIGEDVVVDRIGRAHAAWLTSLDGLSDPASIEESLTIPEADARRLIRALLAASALEDAAAIPTPLRWTPQPQRDIAAARHLAAVHTYRDPDEAAQATVNRDACRVQVVGEGPLADEVARAMESAGFAFDPDGIVILADCPHPDVPVRLGTPAPEVPHLPIGVYGARATVGPLVLPGRTSCLRCAHLHRRDADPAWPLLSVQWAQTMTGLAVPPRDPLLVRLAADHAALLLRAWIDRPDDPTSWAEVALDIRLPSGSITRSERPPHPLCGCLWPPD